MKFITNNNKLSKYWFLLSVASLAFSGLFAIFLVIGRSPYINKLLPHVNFFKSSLTIHVNLSVTVWLLGMIACVYSNYVKAHIKAHKICLLTALVGSILMTLSIFDSGAEAYLNNYIPFIDSSIFKIGIYSFLAVIFFSSILTLVESLKTKSAEPLIFASIILISSIIYFVCLYQLEFLGLGRLFNSEDYFEQIFWGAGHLIQFAYVQLLIFGWLVILNQLNNKDYRIHFIISGFISLAIVFLGAFIPLIHTIETVEYKLWFTDHMIYFGGVSSVYIGFVTVRDILGLLNNKEFDSKKKLLKNCLLWSVILFASGGFIGLNISEVNTVIPAHYHGSIIAVSLSAMAVCYILISQNRFGYEHRFSKLSHWQPTLYGSGQLIHITGFAMSGGYGALRKNPGTLESFEGKLYMGLMGMGGLISIIGGLFFVIIIFRAFNNKLK